MEKDNNIMAINLDIPEDFGMELEKAMSQDLDEKEAKKINTTVPKPRKPYQNRSNKWWGTKGKEMYWTLSADYVHLVRDVKFYNDKIKSLNRHLTALAEQEVELQKKVKNQGETIWGLREELKQEKEKVHALIGQVEGKVPKLKRVLGF